MKPMFIAVADFDDEGPEIIAGPVKTAEHATNHPDVVEHMDTSAAPVIIFQAVGTVIRTTKLEK